MARSRLRCRALLFAAGNALRGEGLAVRSVADGKEAAQVLDHFLRRGELLAIGDKPFSSRIGHLQPKEAAQFLAGATSTPRCQPVAGADYLAAEAAAQSERCFACDCAAHDKCKLERYAIQYGVDPTRFSGARPNYEVIGRESAVQFEPGKCIKCELCIQIAERAAEPLGLTFIGRGFDIRLAVPFDRTLEDGVSQIAQQCVDACPTGALSFPRRR